MSVTGPGDTGVDTALEVRDAGMSFGDATVLQGVSLRVRAGEVHALAGHNGSGKSTLVKILAGRYVPLTGTQVLVGGTPLDLGSPEHSAQLGLRFVHQNLALVPDLSVTENLALGHGYGTQGNRTQSLGRIHWRAEHERTRAALGRLGYTVDPRARTGGLSASTKSAVAVARALDGRGHGPPRVVVLDEVTATMPQDEIDRLLGLVRRLKGGGAGVLLISHHLEELESVADRATVLRNGRVVATLDGPEITVARLTELIMGPANENGRARLRTEDVLPEPPDEERSILEVTGLSGTRLRDLDLTARPGDVIGLSGVTGSGREEVAELIFGSRDREGEVRLDGTLIPPGRPDLATRAGLALVPAERLAQAVIPGMSVKDNVTISKFAGLRNAIGWIRGRRERAEVSAWVRELNIQGVVSLDHELPLLSGGNQQKAILARCLRLHPKVLLLDEPTQGVDVGAVVDIHALIRALARSAIVVVASSDLDELAALCTEVLVFRKGVRVGRLRGADVTEENIMRMELASDRGPGLAASPAPGGAS